MVPVCLAPVSHALFACLAVLALLGPAAARQSEEVDVALVLAVDVSRSMDPEEQDLQRQGFVEAFRSPLVHEAIRGGMLGRVTIVYMEWSGFNEQRVVVPWTIIDGPDKALAFSDALAKSPINRVFQTSISGAIDFSLKLLDDTGVEPLRRVIDISGDGPNSSGRLVTAARDEAVARGVTINGLPIMLKRPTGFGDMENLDQYYRDCVIGGAGAFVVPVRERAQFAEAIKTKIIREISDLTPEPSVILAQAQPESRVDCLTRRGSSFNYGP